MPGVMIAVDEDGAYLVAGEVGIVDQTGRELDLPHAVRLGPRGQSTNQPFCDAPCRTIDLDRTLAQESRDRAAARRPRRTGSS
jgi:hypothetical protein